MFNKFHIWKFLINIILIGIALLQSSCGETAEVDISKTVQFEGKLYFHEQSYQDRAEEILQNDAHKIWNTETLCSSKNALFIATGVCDGWLPGVQFNHEDIKTWSRIIYIETGEVKTIETIHSKNKE